VRFRLIAAALRRPWSVVLCSLFLVLGPWSVALGPSSLAKGWHSAAANNQGEATQGQKDEIQRTTDNGPRTTNQEPKTTHKFFSVNDLRPGLRGVGRTIFEGETIEEFQVEIRGVLKNVLAPKRDVILAHLSGSGLDKTGVVAGMSGSPVYVDGKLVGAVAIAFPFSKDSYALITPIQDMLDVVP